MNEVLFSGVLHTYATGVGTEWNAVVHKEIPHSNWAKWLRWQYKKDNLFVYYHTETNNYVLAQWIFRPEELRGPGLMMELEAFEGHPDKPGSQKPTKKWLDVRMRPADRALNRMKNKINGAQRAVQNRRKEQALLRGESLKRLMRKGSNDEHVRLVRAGRIPFEAGDDSIVKAFSKLRA